MNKTIAQDNSPWYYGATKLETSFATAVPTPVRRVFLRQNSARVFGRVCREYNTRKGNNLADCCRFLAPVLLHFEEGQTHRKE